MAIMQLNIIALIYLIIVGGETGIVKIQDPETLTTKDALSNHTTAIIETVLQNIHRMKNFEERDRLERLVTRFKMLVQELELNAVPLPDGATDLTQNEETLDANRFSSEEKWRNEDLFSERKINEVSTKDHYTNKLTNLHLKSNSKKMDPETAAFKQLNNKNMTTTAKPSLASPILPNQHPTETTNINSSTEEEEVEDDADDKLVQELHHRISNEKPSKPLEYIEERLATTSSPQDELITVAERHSAENKDNLMDDDFDSTEDDDLEMNDQ
uniref:Uncharacterized protein n=1 Tax=Strigamia maritima TaxID=126957 RepID=T1IRP5_STRMM